VAVLSSAGPLEGYLRALQANHTLHPTSLLLRLRRSGRAAGERERWTTQETADQSNPGK